MNQTLTTPAPISPISGKRELANQLTNQLKVDAFVLSASGTDMAKKAALLKVRKVIATHLADLHAKWIPSVPTGHNVFLNASSPQLSQASKDTRELTSRLGFTLEHISRDLSLLRFPAEVRTVLVSNTVNSIDRAILLQQPVFVANNKTRIYSQIEQDKARAAASRLTAYAKKQYKIGTLEFKKELAKELTAIQVFRSQEVWSCEVDFACLNKEIGIVEIKSGGELDSTKSAKETEALLHSYLAYGDINVPFSFATLYANNGEGRAIRGALSGYFQYSPKKNLPTHLLVGKKWWEKVLLPSVSYHEFITLYQLIAKDYEILPYTP